MYSYHDRVSYSRIDKDGLLGVSDTVNAMQDCCLFHSEDVGHSALDLLKKNRAWLVSAWHVVFKRRPVMGERFTVHTWPYQFKGIFGCRNFLMETPDKEVLAYADSRWFYFDPSTGVMATGTKTIDGVQYTFSSSGVLQSSGSNPNTTTPSSSRTIKNFLANALKPVGQTLYVWGGGHNWSDATRKGVSSKWKQWYDNNSSSYNYRNYMDLSESTEQKGLDCSGYVGWSVYQIMQSKSGGVNYTTVSGDIGSLYSGRGMGRIISQSTLSSSNWKLYPGDIGYNDGHTWMVLGQCADKSVVILHCTPNAGVQISGTPTPNGTYGSQAIKLAETYMAKYPGVSKYDYHESSGNYIRNGAYFRWNRSTLSDPDGYLNMTADQILADLFN